MNLKKVYLGKMQFMLLAICIIGFIDSIKAQRGAQRFREPEVDYSPWSPIDVVEFPLEVKTNKARSIQASAPEPVFIPRTASVRNRQKENRDSADSKGQKRRNFEENVEQKPEEKATTSRTTYSRRRPTTTTSTKEKHEVATNRVKVTRKPLQRKNDESSSTSAKPRRQFTARSTSENVLVSTSEAPSSTKASLKRIPFTRGNFRAKTKTLEKNVDGNASSNEENYPEHFKLLLKNKETSVESDKKLLKKPLKPSRPSSVEKTTKLPVRTAAKSNVLYPTRSKAFTRATTTTEVPSSSIAKAVTPNRLLRRPRPTERTKINVGSTLQEPPTAKATASYATRSPVRQFIEESVNVNTQADAAKQIDPPLREYFPRTSAIGSSLKYSSRFRNSDTANKGSYLPTVPSITTTSSLDLTDIDHERWREILPLAAELVHIPFDAEIMTQSSSQTVSIYEALAEILSKPTESLSLSNSKSTDRTLMSEASTSTTSTTTTTTTTSTTPLPPTTEANDDLKENTSHIIDLLQKLKNETDSLVKSANIFSLAKKSHSHADENLDIDPVANQINDRTETSLKPVTATARNIDKVNSTAIPTTSKINFTKNVSIFLKRQNTLTTNLPEAVNDFIDNEISNGSEEVIAVSPTSRSSPAFQPSVEYSTKVSSSSSSTRFVSSTVKVLEKPQTTSVPTENPSTTQTTKAFETISKVQKTSKIPSTTRIPVTTENYIARNYRLLQQLLDAQNPRTQKVLSTQNPIKSTTEMSTTLKRNEKLVEITTTKPLMTAQATTTTTTTEMPEKTSTEVPSTTEKHIESTTKVPSTTTTTTVEPVTEKITTTERTTTAEKTTTTERTTTERTTTERTTTERITTQRPTTTQAPSTFYTKPITSKPKPKAPFSDTEDLAFLRQLAGLINRQPATQAPRKTTVRMTPRTTFKTTTFSTTTTSTTPSTTTSTTTPSTTTSSTTPSTTTSTTAAKTLPTSLLATFSDNDDVAFLNSLRNYAGIINLTTERSALANRILELALNRTGKSVSKLATQNQIDLSPPSFVQPSKSPEIVVKQISETRDNINLMNGVLKQSQDGSNTKKLSNDEVERTKQMLQKDISQYNSDIKLLSLLVGKPITNQDISKLAATNLGLSNRGNSIRSVPASTLPQTTMAATLRSTPKLTQFVLSTSTVPVFKPLSDKEAQFLQALEQIQTTSTTTTTTERVRTASKSQEAIIAALLKQQGFGPNNQIPIEKILEQLPLNNVNQFRPIPTTTFRPFSPLPPLRRQPRPLLDGLAWLWRTWQETAAGPTQPRQRPVQQQSSSIDEGFDDDFNAPSQSASRPSQSRPSAGIDWRGGGGGSQSDANTGDYSDQQPLGAGGLFGAALGVTRAVTQFLGVAFAGAGQAFQSAFTGGSAGPGAAATAGGGNSNNYYAFSGR